MIIGKSVTLAAEVWKSIALAIHVAFSCIDKEFEKQQQQQQNLQDRLKILVPGLARSKQTNVSKNDCK